jgi:hypothetical protein
MDGSTLNATTINKDATIIYQTDILDDDNAILTLGNVLDTIYGIRLETTEKSIIGTIDKIDIRSNNIYALDRYKTKSLKVFDTNGKYLFTVGNTGNGPSEYVEPTDFFVDDNEIIVYDQFQSKFLFYTATGKFIQEKSIPFTFLEFYKFSPNSYLIAGLDADNYHLPELLNYSLWICDSTFHIKHFGMYRKKDKYLNLLPNRIINHTNGNNYYHELRHDSIYSVDSTLTAQLEYVVDFGKYTPKPEAFLDRKLYSEMHNNEKYAFGYNVVVLSNYFYYSFTVNRYLYHLIYSKRQKKSHYGAIIDNDINTIFTLDNILNAIGDTLIGYSDAMHILQAYENLPEGYLDDALNCHGYPIKKDIENFCNGMNMDDNPVIMFYVLKKQNEI